MPISGLRRRSVALALAAVSLAGFHAPAAFAAPAQQPIPAPPPKEEPNSPEARAARDIKKLGEGNTRERAGRLLGDAVRNVEDAMMNLKEGGPVDCDHPAVQDLHDAVRYYAKAHGLPTDVDHLNDLMQTLGGVSGSTVGIGMELEQTMHARLGSRWRTLREALGLLHHIKLEAAVQTCPTPRAVGFLPGQAGGGPGKKPFIIGGAVGAVALGVLAVSGGGDAAGVQPPTVTLTPNFGVWNGTITYTLNSGCSRQGNAFPVSITVSGNPDGSNFACDVQGHRYAGILRADGSFEANYSGVFTFPGLFNSSGTSTITGSLREASPGRQMIATGNIRLTGGPCADNQTQISVTATKN